MATLTNTAGAVITVPDVVADDYLHDGWFYPGSAPLEVKPAAKRTRASKPTAARKRPTKPKAAEPEAETATTGDDEPDPES